MTKPGPQGRQTERKIHHIWTTTRFFKAVYIPLPKDNYKYSKKIIIILSFIFKGFVASATLFLYFLYFFVQYIHSYIHPFAEGPLLLLHCSSLSRGPPWGTEPGFELGPAVQQADALLSELRRTPFIFTLTSQDEITMNQRLTSKVLELARI